VLSKYQLTMAQVQRVYNTAFKALGALHTMAIIHGDTHFNNHIVRYDGIRFSGEWIDYGHAKFRIVENATDPEVACGINNDAVWSRSVYADVEVFKRLFTEGAIISPKHH
jgi:tRNA A-37 threonylcarbamoyl transferase component Bud32